MVLKNPFRRNKAAQLAVVSFLENDNQPIRLVSLKGNQLDAYIFFKVYGAALEEIEQPLYCFPDGEICDLKAALRRIMEERNFHNFYPNLFREDSSAGVYAGGMIQKMLVSRIKELRPDLRRRKMEIKSVDIHFKIPPELVE